MQNVGGWKRFKTVLRDILWRPMFSSLCMYAYVQGLWEPVKHEDLQLIKHLSSRVTCSLSHFITSPFFSFPGVSSVSSISGASVPGTCSTKLCGGAKCGGACLGAVPRNTASAPPKPRQPASNSLRRSQHHSMKVRSSIT